MLKGLLLAILKVYYIFNHNFLVIIIKNYDLISGLEYCNLNYLGTKITDVTLNFGFNGLLKLNTLFLSGLIQVCE